MTKFLRVFYIINLKMSLALSSPPLNVHDLPLSLKRIIVEYRNQIEHSKKMQPIFRTLLGRPTFYYIAQYSFAENVTRLTCMSPHLNARARFDEDLFAGIWVYLHWRCVQLNQNEVSTVHLHGCEWILQRV